MGYLSVSGVRRLGVMGGCDTGLTYGAFMGRQMIPGGSGDRLARRKMRLLFR